MKAVLTGIALAVLTVCGCEPTHTGVVVEAKPPFLFHYSAYAPRVYIERPDGSKTRLGKVGGPFFVVGFITAPGDNCGYISPVLQRIADDFWLDSINVVQITLPTEICPLTEEQRNLCEDPRDNLSRFFDPRRIAWEAFHRPKDGTILLINRWNLVPIIDSRGTIEDPALIIERGFDLQQRWEQDE